MSPQLLNGLLSIIPIKLAPIGSIELIKSVFDFTFHYEDGNNCKQKQQQQKLQKKIITYSFLSIPINFSNWLLSVFNFSM